MRTITEQKPLEEIKQVLEREQKIYLIGCGTCATMCQTGGKEEILNMIDKLKELGKEIVGWMVIPTACDELTREALQQEKDRIEKADAILIMTCAFGVQTVASFVDKPVYPALNTLFMGREETSNQFVQACIQCGECVLGQTAGICPITKCTKGLLNGPCGGTQEGKCEVDKEKDCAWTLIYQRLEKLGRLDVFKIYSPPKNYQKVIKPGIYKLKSEGDNTDVSK